MKKSTKVVLIFLLLIFAVAIVVTVLLCTDKNSSDEDAKKGNGQDSSIGRQEDDDDNDDVDDDYNNDANYDDTDFNFKFLKMENKKENKIYSPLSIRYALKMLSDGANGTTKEQIDNLIGNGNLSKYDDIEDILSLANAMYIRNSYEEYVKDEYKTHLLNAYNAEVKYDAFKNAKNINTWIENKTFGQIKNMLSDESVSNGDNKLILINALAIDMEWKTKFEAEDTREGVFYLDDGSDMGATMMAMETKSEDISYYEGDDVTAISMDLEEYDEEQMEFIAIMPDENLSEYVENFEIENLEDIDDNLKTASDNEGGIHLTIPRFSFDYSLDMVEDLEKLGIVDAFSEKTADFSNMSTTDSMFVGDVLHKANIDFSEEGVKAAAATVIYMNDLSAIRDGEEPVLIKIDKPFMYVIRDKKTGEIWFTGTVYEPNSWSNDKDDYKVEH